MSTQTQKVAVHCHGRHLQAVDWHQHMWLSSDGRLGQIPMALYIAIKEDASLISFGTGASEIDGVKEAVWTRDFALKNLISLMFEKSFKGLSVSTMRPLLEEAFLDTESQNTAQELRCIYAEYKRRSITKVITVTNPSHGARCRRDLDIHVEDVELRRNSYVATSEVPFAGATVADTAILEPPHRGDDKSPPFYRLIPKLFGIASDKKQACHDQLKALLESF